LPADTAEGGSKPSSNNTPGAPSWVPVRIS
jgi:hypothetical protein